MLLVVFSGIFLFGFQNRCDSKKATSYPHWSMVIEICSNPPVVHYSSKPRRLAANTLLVVVTNQQRMFSFHGWSFKNDSSYSFFMNKTK